MMQMFNLETRSSPIFDIVLATDGIQVTYFFNRDFRDCFSGSMIPIPDSAPNEFPVAGNCFEFFCSIWNGVKRSFRLFSSLKVSDWGEWRVSERNPVLIHYHYLLWWGNT